MQPIRKTDHIRSMFTAKTWLCPKTDGLLYFFRIVFSIAKLKNEGFIHNDSVIKEHF